MQTTLILVCFFLRCIVFVCFLSSTNSTPIGLDQKIKTNTKLMNRENGSFIDNPSFLKAHNKKKSASIFYIAAKHCNLTEFEQWWITLVEDDENADLTDRNVLTICDIVKPTEEIGKVVTLASCVFLVAAVLLYFSCSSSITRQIKAINKILPFESNVVQRDVNVDDVSISNYI